MEGQHKTLLAARERHENAQLASMPCRPRGAAAPAGSWRQVAQTAPRRTPLSWGVLAPSARARLQRGRRGRVPARCISKLPTYPSDIGEGVLVRVATWWGAL